MLLVVLALVFWRVAAMIPSFLAYHDPVPGEVLIVEGWMPDYAIGEALSEFRRGGYRYIVTTGDPLLRGAHLAAYNTNAELAAAVLQKMGLSSDSVHAVPSRSVKVDRTFAAATAVRDWLEERGEGVAGVNICSLGMHARRTRYLYQMAMGDSIAVGVIPVIDRSFDPETWWTSSQGVQVTIDETVGWLYAFLWFSGE